MTRARSVARSPTRSTTTRRFDYLNRLQSISTTPAGATANPLSYGYTYNAANQRTRRNEPDESYWVYQYDALGQVVSGRKYWADGTPVAGQQFEYAYDDIGNRAQMNEGGDENGGNLRTVSYTANALNQYSARANPSAVDILGLSTPAATVTVNGQAAYRRGEYFRSELSITNASGPVVTPATALAAAGTNSTSTTGSGAPRPRCRRPGSTRSARRGARAPTRPAR